MTFRAIIGTFLCLKIEKFDVTAAKAVFFSWTIAYKAQWMTRLTSFAAIELPTGTNWLTFFVNK